MLGHVASNPDITRYINFYQTYAIAQRQHSAGANATTQRHTNFATVRGTNIPKDFKMCHFILVRSVNFLDQCFLVTGLDTVHTPNDNGGQQSRQLCSTIAETLFSYSRLFSW